MNQKISLIPISLRAHTGQVYPAHGIILARASVHARTQTHNALVNEQKMEVGKGEGAA